VALGWNQAGTTRSKRRQRTMHDCGRRQRTKDDCGQSRRRRWHLAGTRLEPPEARGGRGQCTTAAGDTSAGGGCSLTATLHEEENGSSWLEPGWNQKEEAAEEMLRLRPAAEDYGRLRPKKEKAVAPGWNQKEEATEEMLRLRPAAEDYGRLRPK